MNKRYIVKLTSKEREELESLIRKGRTQAYRIKHANILLKVDANGPNWTDEQTAKVFSCHCNTVRNVRQRFVEGGFEAALERNKQKKPSREKILDGEKEARLIAIACSIPPGGRERWTLQKKRRLGFERTLRNKKYHNLDQACKVEVVKTLIP